MRNRLFLFFVLAAIMLAGAGVAYWFSRQTSKDTAMQARRDLPKRLAAKDLRHGLPVFIRIFKQESELELWMQRKEQWVLLDIFGICRWSGSLGPKLKEGDRQSPEGFYNVRLGSLNPRSNFYQSFNLGFPNAFDRAHGRTGSFLMVHGRCSSIGCYAMTDPGIEVIYALVEAALRAGQKSVPVHAFPFRMSEGNLRRHAESRWIDFWQDLKPAYDAFNVTGKVPRIGSAGRKYLITNVM